MELYVTGNKDYDEFMIVVHKDNVKYVKADLKHVSFSKDYRRRNQTWSITFDDDIELYLFQTNYFNGNAKVTKYAHQESFVMYCNCEDCCTETSLYNSYLDIIDEISKRDFTAAFFKRGLSRISSPFLKNYIHLPVTNGEKYVFYCNKELYVNKFVKIFLECQYGLDGPQPLLVASLGNCKHNEIYILKCVNGENDLYKFYYDNHQAIVSNITYCHDDNETKNEFIKNHIPMVAKYEDDKLFSLVTEEDLKNGEI